VAGTAALSRSEGGAMPRLRTDFIPQQSDFIPQQPSEFDQRRRLCVEWATNRVTRAFKAIRIAWGYALGSGPLAPANKEPIMECYLKVLRQYTDFAGRARRKEYWMFTLVSVIVSILLAILDTALGTGLLGLLYSVAVLVPGLAVGVRRLHDTGRSAWWLLIALVPLIGAIVLVVFFATDGERRPNFYGLDPKAAPAGIPALS